MIAIEGMDLNVDDWHGIAPVGSIYCDPAGSY